MQRAQLTDLILKLDREEQSLTRQQPPAPDNALAVVRPSPPNNKHAFGRRAVTYGAVCLPFLFLLAVMWIQPGLTRQEMPDWKPVFALADVAREKGELYNARGLYAQAGKFAAARQDWTGLVAAACGLSKIEREKGPQSGTNALLLRAMAAAEARQSRLGMAAVAKAFTALGENKVASMVLSHVQSNWVEEINASPDAVMPDCWNR